ncbi:hypothetical protein GGR51DRAFT_557035 [Nemania sp. FL0031]|nr:hypothetical protein GGR51DRAFT_557035 [Nemania sp. FL0031]
MARIKTQNGPIPLGAYSPYRGLSPLFPKDVSDIIHGEDQLLEGGYVPASALKVPDTEKPDNTLVRGPPVAGASRSPLANGNFMLHTPGASRPILYTKDPFTGKVRRRQMIDDFFDRVKEENPEKFAEYARRRGIAKEYEKDEEDEKDKEDEKNEEDKKDENDEEESDEESLVVATTTSPPAQSNFMVRNPSTNRLVPHTIDHFTGKVRPRQMMDDFLDRLKEEKPAEFARYLRQHKRAYRRARQ